MNPAGTMQMMKFFTTNISFQSLRSDFFPFFWGGFSFSYLSSFAVSFIAQNPLFPCVILLFCF